MAEHILVPTAVGEVLDKISILRIKADNLTDAAKIRNVRHELALLRQAFAARFPDPGPDVERLADELYGVNRQLWVIEDRIRECEGRGDFREDFIALARSVYITNDRRAALKRQINMALGSSIVEEKSYASYQSGSASPELPR